MTNGENFTRQKSQRVIKVITPKNPLINNQAVTSIKNLTNYSWPISKNQSIIESLPKELPLAYKPYWSITSGRGATRILSTKQSYWPKSPFTFFLFDGKDEFIKTKQRNYKEVGLLLSTLVIDSKEWGQQPISKEPNTLYLRDHLATKGPSTRLPNAFVIHKNFATMNFCTCKSVVHN